MRLSVVALASILESVLTAPVPAISDRGVNFTVPLPPADPSLISEWVDDILAMCTTQLWETLGAQGVGKMFPQYTIDWLANFVSFGTPPWLMPPNFNTDFDPVDGVSNEQVKWFIEANDRTEDDPVVLYLHGGGYSLSLLPLYATNLWNLYHDLGNDRLSILWMDYSLAINGQAYPTQLREGAAVYNQLTKTSKNIIIEGDSAGGHMALNMLRTMAYPVDTIESLQIVPNGMILMSPAVMFDCDPNNGTMAEYQGRDLIDALALNQMGYSFSAGDADVQASVFFNQWKDFIDWKPLLPDPSKVMTTYGEIEVLRGPVEAFLDLAFGGHTTQDSGSTVVMEPMGQHDGIIRGRQDYLWGPYVDFHKQF